MKQNLVVISADLSYAEALVKNLNLDISFPFYVTHKESIEEVSKEYKEESIDVLLLDKELSNQKINNLKIGQLYYLTDIQGYYAVDAVPVIYKYQSLFRIKEEILRLVENQANNAEENSVQTSRCNYIGVLSPLGHSYKTTFSLILGALLSQTSKVLYLGLEPFSGFQQLFEKEFAETLSDLIYAHEIEEEKELTGMIENFHGLQIIPPVHLAEDIFQCDPLKLREMVQQIVRNEIYDVVIIDFGNEFKFVESFLPILNRIYVPESAEDQENGKILEFKNWFLRARKEQSVDIKEVVLPTIHSFVSGKASLEQMMWNEMGNTIRKLIGQKG